MNDDDQSYGWHQRLRRVVSLRGRRAFEAVRTSGRIFRGEHFRFFYNLVEGQPSYTRIGVIVPKRYGSAVHRNLVKRRMREACRPLASSTEKKLGGGHLTLSVVAMYGGVKSRPAVKVHFDEIKDDVARFVDVVQTLANK